MVNNKNTRRRNRLKKLGGASVDYDKKDTGHDDAKEMSKAVRDQKCHTSIDANKDLQTIVDNCKDSERVLQAEFQKEIWLYY